MNRQIIRYVDDEGRVQEVANLLPPAEDVIMTWDKASIPIWDEVPSKYRELKLAVLRFLKADGHDLCWENRKELAQLVGYEEEDKTVPSWCEFMTKCAEYRKSLDE